MPRPYKKPRPPCPNDDCSASLSKCGRRASGKVRYRCAKCSKDFTLGKSADWIAVASEVMSGTDLATMALRWGATEEISRRMLHAWTERAKHKHKTTRINPGQACWIETVDGREYSLGLSRAPSYRLLGWSGQKSPALVAGSVDAPMVIGGQSGAAWLRSVLDCATSSGEREDRLWLVLARSNGWRLE